MCNGFRLTLQFALIAVGWMSMSIATAQQVGVANVARTSDTTIVISVTFSTPRADVFNALTQCRHIRQWMQPNGMKLVDCSMQPRADGLSHFVFATGRRPIGVDALYRKVVEPSIIEYDESYDFSPLQVAVATELLENERRTSFRQTLTYRSKADCDADFDSVASSAKQMYPVLESYVRSGKASR